MRKIWWSIFVEDVSGEIVKAFTWTRDKNSGIEEAKRSAVDFGVTPVKVWAEPIEVN